jgi:hypothetical protein
MRLRLSLLIALCGCAREAPPRTAPAREPSALALTNVVDAIASGALAALGPDARDAVRRSPLPVLLWSDPLAAAATVATAGPRWYALSARVGERTLSLHATFERPSEDGAPPAGHSERARGRPAMVLFNEGIRSVTWSESGATYALEVECARPFDDPACAQSAFVLGLAESLVRAPATPAGSVSGGAERAPGASR